MVDVGKRPGNHLAIATSPLAGEERAPHIQQPGEHLTKSFAIHRARSIPLVRTSQPESQRRKKPVKAVTAESSDTSHSGLNTALIEEELQQILTSKMFSKSPRLKHLFQYITGCWLSGKTNQLDGYNLAIAVFNRGTTFESGSDPIVRVEVSRLRQHLADYYAGEGASSLIRIDIPKGGYIPVVSKRSHGSYVEAIRSDLPRTAVIVLPFVQIGTIGDMNCTHAIAISDHLIYFLTRTQKLRVTSRVSSFHLEPELDARQLGRHYGAHFVIEGTFALASNRCDIMVHLAETIDDYNIWSGKYATDIDCLASAAESISRDILREISQFQVSGENNRPESRVEM